MTKKSLFFSSMSISAILLLTFILRVCLSTFTDVDIMSASKVELGIK